MNNRKASIMNPELDYRLCAWKDCNNVIFNYEPREKLYCKAFCKKLANHYRHYKAGKHTPEAYVRFFENTWKDCHNPACDKKIDPKKIQRSKYCSNACYVEYRSVRNKARHKAQRQLFKDMKIAMQEKGGKT